MAYQSVAEVITDYQGLSSYHGAIMGDQSTARLSRVIMVYQCVADHSRAEQCLARLRGSRHV